MVVGGDGTGDVAVLEGADDVATTGAIFCGWPSKATMAVTALLRATTRGAGDMESMTSLARRCGRGPRRAQPSDNNGLITVEAETAPSVTASVFGHKFKGGHSRGQSCGPEVRQRERGAEQRAVFLGTHSGGTLGVSPGEVTGHTARASCRSQAGREF